MENPYYNPETWGLGIFDEVNTGGSYEFDQFVIWEKLEDSTLWYGTDSGCSCPTPFEHFHEWGDLTQITKESFHSFDIALQEHHDIDRGDYHSVRNKVKKFLDIRG